MRNVCFLFLYRINTTITHLLLTFLSSTLLLNLPWAGSPSPPVSLTKTVDIEAIKVSKEGLMMS